MRGPTLTQIPIEDPKFFIDNHRYYTGKDSKMVIGGHKYNFGDDYGTITFSGVFDKGLVLMDDRGLSHAVRELLDSAKKLWRALKFEIRALIRRG